MPQFHETLSEMLIQMPREYEDQPLLKRVTESLQSLVNRLIAAAGLCLVIDFKFVMLHHLFDLAGS